MTDRPETPEPASRPTVAALDAILGEPFRVLDEGFVRVVDYMGDDAAIVQAARVSYGKGTKRVQQDRALIRYLMRHAHTTPFEMCEIKLHVRVPMDTWRQWIRHRTASVNEYSTRYSEAIDAAQRTPADAWRLQSSANRQGSSGTVAPETGAHLTRREEDDAAARARGLRGRESRPAWRASRRARTCRSPPTPRPTGRSTFTTCCTSWRFGWTTTRSRRSAPTPTSSAEQIVARWVPTAWQAFVDYRMRATQLSRLETELVRALAAGDGAGATALVEAEGLLERTPDGQLRPNYERREVEEKLQSLGWTPPWLV